MYIYRAIRHKLSTRENGLYATNGILALRVLAGRWKTVRLVPDVSVDARLVQSLADRCTAGQLDPRQLDDVIDDALSF